MILKISSRSSYVNKGSYLESLVENGIGAVVSKSSSSCVRRQVENRLQIRVETYDFKRRT